MAVSKSLNWLVLDCLQGDSPVRSNVLALTTSRAGGVSLPPYHSFNLGCHVGDNPIHVQHNRDLLLSSLPENAQLQWLNQVHGNVVADITQVQTTAITADAAFTTRKNIALAILTADCLPILLVNDEGTEIAAIHGGWKPLAANIIENTLAKFQSTNIHAWLGPCIGEHAFEVGVEVKQHFTLLDAKLDNAFVLQANGKYLANLHFIARYLLNKHAVSTVSCLAECTVLSIDEYCDDSDNNNNNNHKYFSYRRDGQTGRMASVICIPD